MLNVDLASLGMREDTAHIVSSSQDLKCNRLQISHPRCAQYIGERFTNYDIDSSDSIFFGVALMKSHIQKDSEGDGQHLASAISYFRIVVVMGWEVMVLVLYSEMQWWWW